MIHSVNYDLGLWFLLCQQHYDVFALEYSRISENILFFKGEGPLLWITQGGKEGFYLPNVIYRLDGN